MSLWGVGATLSSAGSSCWNVKQLQRLTSERKLLRSFLFLPPSQWLLLAFLVMSCVVCRGFLWGAVRCFSATGKSLSGRANSSDGLNSSRSTFCPFNLPLQHFLGVKNADFSPKNDHFTNGTGTFQLNLQINVFHGTQIKPQCLKHCVDVRIMLILVCSVLLSTPSSSSGLPTHSDPYMPLLLPHLDPICQYWLCWNAIRVSTVEEQTI